MQQDVSPSLDPGHQSDICIKATIASERGVLDEIANPDGPVDSLALVRPTNDRRLFKVEVIDHKLLDVLGLKQCLDACDRSHGDGCRGSLAEIDSPAGFLLVDVLSRRIVSPAGTESDFITLSYVWGSQTASRSIYRAGDPLSELPRTIEDAMQLTKSLGKQYLWVDYLCITQDDPAAKQAQIQQMFNIYRAAYANIVALCGSHMDSGLTRAPGSRRIAQPQLECKWSGHRLLGTMPNLSQEIEHSVWNTRAWTLQEGFLSSRNIYITDHQAHFECNAFQACESFGFRSPWPHAPLSHDQQSDNETLFDEPGGWRRPTEFGNVLERHAIYAWLVHRYTSRTLTDQDDVLNAFSGTLRYLEESAYPKGFFFALPVDHLTWGLRWRCYRRYAGDREFFTGRPSFLTWSWSGWEWPIVTQALSKTSPALTTFCAWKWNLDQPELLFKSRESGQTHLSKGPLFDRPTTFDDPRANTAWQDWVERETQEISTFIKSTPQPFEIPDSTLVICCFTITHIPSPVVSDSRQHLGDQSIYLNDVECQLIYDWPSGSEGPRMWGQNKNRIDYYKIDPSQRSKQSKAPLSEQHTVKEEPPSFTHEQRNVPYQMLALIDRDYESYSEDSEDWMYIHHWLLDLDVIEESQGEVKAVRRDLFDLIVPKHHPEALDVLDPTIRRVFLV